MEKTLTEPKLQEEDLASQNDARVKRAEERVGDAHPATSTAEKTKAKHFDGSYQSMLFGSAGTLQHPAWSDSTKGRLAIRMFSRGILGAALFTIGGRVSRAQLLDYNPETFEWAMAKKRPLQGLAKIFDEGFGKPIGKLAEMGVKTKGLTEAEIIVAKAKASQHATTFRTASYYHTWGGKLDTKTGSPMVGRSLGAEIVNVSFDFAMMSVGDAAGRNFVQMIDPHIRKTWMVNDKGEKAKEGEKAHFSASKFAESWGRSAWRIISKNQGEDWAVALPYVYQMRWQRKMLSKAFEKDSKGIKLVFDHAWNGAAYKVNPEGKIVGDYQLAGAIDLHGRFVGYNVLTLMYREGYDAISNGFKKWKENGYQVHMPKHIDPIGGTKEAVRYGVKSFIKANLYMNPAVVPFWLMRVPQTKWRGALISTEIEHGANAILSREKQSKRLYNIIDHIKKNSKVETHLIVDPPHGQTIYNYSTAKRRILPGSTNQPLIGYVGDKEVSNPMYYAGPHDWSHYQHYEKGFGKTFSQALNPFGQFSYWLGGKATALANKLPEGAIKNFISMEDGAVIAEKRYRNRVGYHPAGEILTPEELSRRNRNGREQFMRNFVDASLAYTPYFFAKSELGLRVDDRPSTGGMGKMDKAIYKLIDNVVALNPGKTGASVKEIWNLSTHRERVVMREGNHNNPDHPVGKPHTTVQGGRNREPLTPVLVPTAPNNNEVNKNWTDSVAAKHPAGHFPTPDSQTRH